MIDEIKKLDLKSSLTYYGLNLNFHDKAKCILPQHREKTASVKIYKDRWVCFGCGKSGDIVDFVKEYFGLDFQGACKKICEDFGIGGIKLTYEDKKRIKNERRKRHEEEERRKQREEKYWETYAIFAEYDKIAERFRPKRGEEINDAWIMANNYREMYWDKILGWSE